MTVNINPRGLNEMLDPKDVAIVAPGAAALLASWMGILETTLSITLLAVSLAFLIWRWRVAIKRGHDGH